MTATQLMMLLLIGNRSVDDEMVELSSKPQTRGDVSFLKKHRLIRMNKDEKVYELTEKGDQLIEGVLDICTLNTKG